jgi:hypothetical protein
MKFSDALLVVKEFFLEFLGFLIPGIIGIFLPFFFLNENSQVKIITYFKEEYHLALILLFGYALGYVIYGASLLRDRWGRLKAKEGTFFHKIPRFESFLTFQEKLFNNIKNSYEFRTSIELLKQKIDTPKFSIPDEPRSVRNLVMSYIPESDTKIYTFTFRADLCKHLALVSIIVAFFGVISVILKYFNLTFLLKNDYTNFVFYLILIIFAHFLGETRRRFYGIAQRLAFPIFIAKLTYNEE